MLESDDSELESADSSCDPNSDPPRIGVWVWALSGLEPEMVHSAIGQSYWVWSSQGLFSDKRQGYF